MKFLTWTNSERFNNPNEFSFLYPAPLSLLMFILMFHFCMSHSSIISAERRIVMFNQLFAFSRASLVCIVAQELNRSFLHLQLLFAFVRIFQLLCHSFCCVLFQHKLFRWWNSQNLKRGKSIRQTTHCKRNCNSNANEASLYVRVFQSAVSFLLLHSLWK